MTISRVGAFRPAAASGTNNEKLWCSNPDQGFTLAAPRPNPSFEARPNGKPPSPGRWYAVHFHRPGLGVLPSVPPQLER